MNPEAKIMKPKPELLELSRQLGGVTHRKIRSPLHVQTADSVACRKSLSATAK